MARISAAVCALLMLFFLAGVARAQQPAPPKPLWSVEQCDSPAPGNVFYPGEAVTLTLTLSRKDKKPLELTGGSWQICEIEEFHQWPPVNNIRPVGKPLLQGAIAAQRVEKLILPVGFLPKRLGSYGVYVTLADGSGAGAQLATAFAIVYPPAAGRKADSPLVLNLGGDNIPRFSATYQRLGYKWIRWETGWETNERKPGEYDWTRTDAWVNAARDHDLSIMCIMAHAPEWAAPKLNNKWVYYSPGKPETNCGPEFLPQWQEWARRFVERYKDTVRAGIMLNEPWEGGSISGWHGNGAQYRALLKAFAAGVHAADPTFTVLANDSGMNAEDNILSEKGAIDNVDAISSHTYASWKAYEVAQFRAYGKPVWETESWISGSGKEHVRQVVLEIAQGFVKTQPVPEDALLGEVSNRQGGGYARPSAQALSVLLHFIEDTSFYKEPRPECAPYMFVFKGRTDAKKNVAVVFGPQGHNYATFFGPNNRDRRGDLWDQLQRDGVLRLNDPKQEVAAFDMSGNPLPRKGAALEVPVAAAPVYLVDSEGPDRLAERLASATLSRMEPAQIALLDFTKPLALHPPLRVRVTNAYNVPLTGTVKVTAPKGWTLARKSAKFQDLAPGDTTELAFQVNNVKESTLNRYPFTVTVDTKQGKASWTEELSVATFIKGTPPLDGTAEAWMKLGAVPVYLAGKDLPINPVEQYMFPFKQLQLLHNEGYFIQFMGMWDDKHFYVFADINDKTETRHPSPEKGTTFLMHDKPYDWEYWWGPVLPATSGDMLNLAFNVLPYGEKQIANFPPEAQQQVDPRWQIGIADYEYSLYLAEQNKLADGDYQRALAEYADPKLNKFPAPHFTTAGAPVPELWRLMAPGLPRHNAFPFSPRAAQDQGLVTSAQLAVTREGNVWHYRAAIPWRELALVQRAAVAGKPVKFAFLCRNDGGLALNWANLRSASRVGSGVVHPTWESNWTPETEWGFVDLTPKAEEGIHW